MRIVEPAGSLPERPAPVRHRSLRVVLSRAEVDLPAAERAVADLAARSSGRGATRHRLGPIRSRPGDHL